MKISGNQKKEGQCMWIDESYDTMRKNRNEFKKFVCVWGIPKLQSVKCSRHDDGWIVVKINQKYYYIIVGFSGLFFCIQSASSDEKKMVMGKKMSPAFYFNEEDRIFLKNSLNTEKVPDEWIVDKLDERSFKNKYGMSLYDLKDHLMCASANLLNT